jgi:hypothetical protein
MMCVTALSAVRRRRQNVAFGNVEIGWEVNAVKDRQADRSKSLKVGTNLTESFVVGRVDDAIFRIDFIVVGKCRLTFLSHMA